MLNPFLYSKKKSMPHIPFSKPCRPHCSTTGAPLGPCVGSVEKLNDHLSNNSSMATRNNLIRMEQHARELEVENRIEKALRKRANSLDSIVSSKDSGSDPMHTVITGSVAIAAVLTGFLLGSARK